MYIKVAISCIHLWCKEGRPAFCDRTLWDLVLDLKAALNVNLIFVNFFKFETCRRIYRSAKQCHNTLDEGE